MNQDDNGGSDSGDSGDPADDGGKLSLDSCLELLANRQRRLILSCFVDSTNEIATVDEIVSEISDAEADRTGERPGHDSVTATLFHVHLPKLADADVLEYDTRHLEVRYLGNSRLEDVYDTIRELD